MDTENKAKLTQFATCALCTVLTWQYGSSLEGIEFSGGWLTGPLLDLKDVGSLMFVLALFLTIFFRRVAAVVAVASCLMTIPLYLYFIAPGIFRAFGGEFSVPYTRLFILNRRPLLDLCALSITGYLAVRSALSVNGRRSKSVTNL